MSGSEIHFAASLKFHALVRERESRLRARLWERESLDTYSVARGPGSIQKDQAKTKQKLKAALPAE